MDKLRKKARVLRNSATEAERHIWQHLRLKQLGGFKFRRQVPLQGYVADFLCVELKLIVELDGGQHSEQIAYDENRTGVLQGAGYRVLRYWNNDALLRTSEVLEDILRKLEEIQSQSAAKSKIQSTPPQSSPALRAREEANIKSKSKNHA
jgi:very-short-patch-repair endonuclease